MLFCVSLWTMMVIGDDVLVHDILTNVHGICRNPNLAKCGGEAQHLEKLGDLESSGTPECLELDSKGQNT
jgi:hypothetical protein